MKEDQASAALRKEIGQIRTELERHVKYLDTLRDALRNTGPHSRPEQVSEIQQGGFKVADSMKTSGARLEELLKQYTVTDLLDLLRELEDNA